MGLGRQGVRYGTVYRNGSRRTGDKMIFGFGLLAMTCNFSSDELSCRWCRVGVISNSQRFGLSRSRLLHTRVEMITSMGGMWHLSRSDCH